MMNSLMQKPNEQVNEQQAEQPNNAMQGMGGAEQAAPNPAQETEGIVKQAVALLYGDNFDGLVQLFKTGGVDGFANAIATAINTVIKSLEEQQPITPEIAAAVGMKLFFMLLEDVVKGELLPQLPMAVIQEGLGKTIAMYAKSHPDTVTEQDMQAFVQEIGQRQGAST